jgi:lysozyme
MKKQNENGRIPEDRLSRANKRKKNNTIASILVMTGCLLVLVLVTYVAGILYSWIDSKFQDNANDLAAAAEAGSQTEESTQEVVKTYTQEEVDALIAEAKQQAEDEEENKILSGIRDGLTSGTTMVETLRPYYPNELVVVSNGTFNFVPIRDDLQKNDYVLENLNILEDGEVQYMQDGQVVSHKGIDVSKHQGNIDWTKVAADGVEFAFIRVGLRGYGTEGKLVEDEYFEQNVKGALQAGIKVGVYFYSQAITDEELLEEANLVLEKVKPYNIELPIVFDVEKVSGGNELSVEERTRLTALFCQTIQDAGYKPMIYHNMEMGTLMLDLGQLEQYDKWFAYYNDDLYYPYAYKVWQYSEKGAVDGINEEVDLNIWFGDF